jgi:hypothetical protein
MNANEARELIDYNPETGEMRRNTTHKRWMNRPPGSADKDGYTILRVGGRLFRAHRLAWLLHYGEWPDGDIDHVNGIRTDNRISNLRECNAMQNAQNRIGQRGCSLFKPTGRWKAKIRSNGIEYHLGYFDSEAEAVGAYRKAKEELHEFRRAA